MPPRGSDPPGHGASNVGQGARQLLSRPGQLRVTLRLVQPDKCTDCWRLFGHGALMIELTASKQCIGQVGINHGPLFPEQELGWLLYDGHEGHGYATEAARALRDWAFATLKLSTLVSYMAPDNAMSAAVAKRLGGVLDPSAPREDPDDLVYRYRVR